VKLFSDCPNASMSFGNDPALRQALARYVLPARVDTIIETGTFTGQGSTKVLANLFQSQGSLKVLVTIEAKFAFYRQARRNLRDYGFVDCRWGETVNRAKALKFIGEDEAIKNHASYPDIWIDNVTDPIAFYSAEVSGQYLDERPRGVYRQARLYAKKILRQIEGRYNTRRYEFLFEGSDLLTKFCTIHHTHRPLIVLDSSGGIGYLEFQTVRDAMADVEYYILLDDIGHLKHFRSARDIRASIDFEILAENATEQWLLARHKPDKKIR
jgi:hypothetical protein